MLFRSEKMNYFELTMPHDSAWSILNNLGGIKSLSFIDMNQDIPSFTRHYANYIRRTEDCTMVIRQVEVLINQFDIEVGHVKDPVDFLDLVNKTLEGREQAEHTYFDDIESTIHSRYEGIKTLNNNYNQLNDQINALKEYKLLLGLIKPFIPDNFKYNLFFKKFFN